MKRVLMVIPFESIYPPMNGGMLRCFNLLHQLCRNFKVTVLLHQDKASFMKAAAEFPAITSCEVLSTKDNPRDRSLFALLPEKLGTALKFRWRNRSITEPADGNYLLLYPQMKAFLKGNAVDYVILEDMAILGLAKLVKRYHPGVPVFYDAYNVNTRLAATALEKGEIDKTNFELIKRIETNLFRYTDKVFACSEGDLLQLREMNGGRIDGAVIPNGVGIPNGAGAVNGVQKGPHDLLFCGSLDYLPNKEGLSWFCREVFPLVLDAVPDARLLVVGRGDPGPELTALLKHPAIVNHGRVESVAKYYRETALAVVPLLSGSGTRLKLLEAMAYRAPVVATAIGAEGIGYTDGKDILIADEPVSFARGIVGLLHEPDQAAKIAEQAFALVHNEYDWDIIGKKLALYLNSFEN